MIATNVMLMFYTHHAVNDEAREKSIVGKERKKIIAYNMRVCMPPITTTTAAAAALIGRSLSPVSSTIF